MQNINKFVSGGFLYAAHELSAQKKTFVASFFQ